MYNHYLPSVDSRYPKATACSESVPGHPSSLPINAGVLNENEQTMAKILLTTARTVNGLLLFHNEFLDFPGQLPFQTDSGEIGKFARLTTDSFGLII